MTDYYFVIDELEFPQTNEQTETLIDSGTIENNIDYTASPPISAVDPLSNNTTIPNNLSPPINFVNIANNNHINTINLRPSQKLGTIAFKTFNMYELIEKSNPILREVTIWQQYHWNCFLCTFIYDYYKLLTNHLRDTHQVICEEDIRYQCNDCSRVYDEYSKFINHVREHHPNLKTACDVCGRSYEQYDMLAKHREVAHSDHANLRPKIFYCNQCEMTFSTKEQVDNHCINHIWVCQTCNKEFDKKNEYYHHKISHAIERRTNTKLKHSSFFQCHYCAQKFTEQDELLSHLKVHSIQLPFKCPKCDAFFSTKEESDTHALVHNMVRCQFCPQILNNSDEYKRHIKVHFETASEPRKPKCKKCGKIFGTNMAQMKHTKFSCLRHSLAFRRPTKIK